MAINQQTVSLIGAGPNHPGLLSRRAERLLKNADLIMYDHLVNPFILQLAPASVEMIDVGKIPYTRHIRQEKINEMLVEKGKSYDRIIRIKGGDPAIFGRVQEEVQVLIDNDIRYEIVPGITAASAAVAMFGIGLTGRNVSTNVTITTGHFKDSLNRDINLRTLLDEGTLAIYMGVKRLPHLMDQIKSQTDVDYSVAMVFNVSNTMQKLVRGTVSTIVQKIQEVNYEGPAVIIVGDIVDYMDTTHTRPLKYLGMKFLLKGPREEMYSQAEDIYDHGGFSFIDDREFAKDMHPSQSNWIEEVLNKHEFDEIIEYDKKKSNIF